ncbi:MAG: hypothetical protein NTX82_02365 [Candidatus Parcubacteria bacterium]|nr:hypothetical protein [Candidatus Parcubacteria bacterium]
MWLYSISKFFEHPYREDLWAKINFVASVLINVTLWGALYFKLHSLSYLSESGQISLHYNIYFGIDNIGPWYNVFIIPILGLIIIILNNVLAYIFFLQEKTISYLFIFSQTIIQVILFAAGIFVILLNI